MRTKSKAPPLKNVKDGAPLIQLQRPGHPPHQPARPGHPRQNWSKALVAASRPLRNRVNQICKYLMGNHTLVSPQA